MQKSILPWFTQSTRQLHEESSSVWQCNNHDNQLLYRSSMSILFPPPYPYTIYADSSKIGVKELPLAWLKNLWTSSFISRLCVRLTHTQRNQSLNGTYPYKIAISQVTWRKRARNGNRAFETLYLFWWRKLHILHTIGSIQIRPRAMCMNSVDYSKRIDHWVTIDKEQYC